MAYLLSEFLAMVKISEKVFKPTGTTKLLALSAEEFIIHSPISTVLDLGCGNGIIGLYLKNRFPNLSIQGSDLSIEAVKLAELNSKNLKLDVSFFVSDLFKSINQTLKFDLIINDVSGIAKSLADKSSWFVNVPTDSGENGIALTEAVITDSINFLNPNGTLILPIISLSESKKLLDLAKKYFKNINELSSESWPMTSPSKEFIEVANNLKADGKIDFEEKFGKMIITTKIFSFDNRKG